jgi:hypothetical protein
MADIHRREYLILLRGLSERGEDFEGCGVQRRMALWIDELKEELERNRGFRQIDHLSLRRKACGRKALGADFEILPMDFEKDSIGRLKCDIRV